MGMCCTVLCNSVTFFVSCLSCFTLKSLSTCMLCCLSVSHAGGLSGCLSICLVCLSVFISLILLILVFKPFYALQFIIVFTPACSFVLYFNSRSFCPMSPLPFYRMCSLCLFATPCYSSLYLSLCLCLLSDLSVFVSFCLSHVSISACHSTSLSLYIHWLSSLFSDLCFHHSLSPSNFILLS